MDRFEEMAEKMAAMPEDELKETVTSLMARCICGNCPTYGECMKGRRETLFCALGKTACPAARKACLCPACSVTPAMGLKHGFYCLRGSEKEIRGL